MKSSFFRSIIAILIVLSLTGCGNEERKSFYDNGQVKTIGFYDTDGKRQDAFKMYAEDGSLLEETTYKDNKIVSGYVIKNNIETNDGIKHTLIKKTEYNNGLIKNIKVNNDKNEILTDLNYDNNGNKFSGFETIREDYSVKFNPSFPYASFGYQITSTANIIKNEYTNGKITNTTIIQEGNKELISDAMAAIIGDQLSKRNNNFCKVFKNSIELQEIYLNTIVSHSHHIKGDVAQKLYDEYACMRKELTSPKTEEKFVQAISDTKKLLNRNYTDSFKVSKYFDLLTFEQKKSLLKDNKNILKEFKSFNGLSKDLLIFITIEFEKRKAFEAIPVTQLTEEDKKYLIENKPEIYPLIPSPSIELQKIAVEKYPRNIQYIKNPSEDLILFALEKDVNVIKYIKTPLSEKQYIRALTSDIRLIQFIPNPSDRIVEFVISKDPSLIGLVSNPFEELQLKVLDQNINNIQFIQNPTNKVIIMVLEKYPEYIGQIKDQTPEMQELVMNKNPLLLLYLNNPNYDLIIKGISANPDFIPRVIRKFPTNYEALDNKVLELKGEYILKYKGGMQYRLSSEQIELAFSSNPDAVLRLNKDFISRVPSAMLKSALDKNPSLCSRYTRDDISRKLDCVKASFKTITYFLYSEKNTYNRSMLCSNYFRSIINDGWDKNKDRFKSNQPCMNTLNEISTIHSLIRGLESEPRKILYFEKPPSYLMRMALEKDNSLIEDYISKNWFNGDLLFSIYYSKSLKFEDYLKLYKGKVPEELKNKLKNSKNTN